MATRWSLGALFAGLVAAAPAFAQEAGKDDKKAPEPPFVGKVTAENVNIRMMAGKDGKIVRVARDGETVIVVGREKGWYEIVAPENAWCWISSAALKRSPEGGAVIKHETPLRADSRNNAAVIGSIAAGAEVKVLSEKGEWAKIQAPKSVGFWVSENFVDFIEAYDAAKNGPIEVAGAAGTKPPEKPAVTPTPAPGPAVQPPAASPAADRARDELNKIADQLDSLRKDEERRSREAAESNAAATKTEKFQYEGWVDTVGLFIGRPGAHQLTKGGKTVCYLKAGDSKTNLNQFYNKYVGINGNAEPAQGFEPLEVVTVDTIKIITRD